MAAAHAPGAVEVAVIGRTPDGRIDLRVFWVEASAEDIGMGFHRDRAFTQALQHHLAPLLALEPGDPAWRLVEALPRGPCPRRHTDRPSPAGQADGERQPLYFAVSRDGYWSGVRGWADGPGHIQLPADPARLKRLQAPDLTIIEVAPGELAQLRRLPPIDVITAAAEAAAEHGPIRPEQALAAIRAALADVGAEPPPLLDDFLRAHMLLVAQEAGPAARQERAAEPALG